MRPLSSQCLAAFAFVLLFLTPATAAPRAIRPIPAQECQRFADMLSKQLGGMKLTVAMDGRPAAWAEAILVTGTGCTLAGSKLLSSLPANFEFMPLETPAFQGWSRVMEAGWESTEGASGGIFRGDTTLLYQYAYVLPEKYCKAARDLETCQDKYRDKYLYEFKAVLFTFTDGQPITAQDFKPSGEAPQPQPAADRGAQK